jgi:ribosomal protein S27AE
VGNIFQVIYDVQKRTNNMDINKIIDKYLIEGLKPRMSKGSMIAIKNRGAVKSKQVKCPGCGKTFQSFHPDEPNRKCTTCREKE